MRSILFTPNRGRCRNLTAARFRRLFGFLDSEFGVSRSRYDAFARDAVNRDGDGHGEISPILTNVFDRVHPVRFVQDVAADATRRNPAMRVAVAKSRQPSRCLTNSGSAHFCAARFVSS